MFTTGAEAGGGSGDDGRSALMMRLWWHCGRWTIVPARCAPRRYKPLRDAAYRSWVERGMPHNAGGGYYKRAVWGRGGDDGA